MEQYADLTFLKTFTGGDPEKMKKYINLFLGGATPALESINNCLAGSDWSGLRTAAHSLKSQVKYMGIKKAEELAYFIEQNAGNQTNLDQIPGAVKQLSEITVSACEELKQVVSSI